MTGMQRRLRGPLTTGSARNTCAVSRTGRFGLLTITVDAHGAGSPHDVQAQVVAQDRWLVMDPATPIHDSPQKTSGLARPAAMAADRAPGEVLLCRGVQPLRLWAVIHDLDRVPTCRAEWIGTALLNILRELARQDIESVSMPCLGCAQGILDAGQFLRLLADAIHKAPVVHRLRLTLDCEPASRDALCAALQRLEF